MASSNSTPASIDIVIVNWNSGDLLAQCLTSIEDSSAHSKIDTNIIVVDNASNDGSANRYRGARAITLIENASNEGFGRACNQGAAAGKADYILFFNPDACLIPATNGSLNGLEKACAFLQSPAGSDFGVCGVQLIDEAGHIARSCARFPSSRHFFNDAMGLSRFSPERFPGVHLSGWDHSRSCAVDHVIGAFYLVRRCAFEQVSGFDENFFVYLEDLDLSARLHHAGFNSYYLATAQAYHVGGGVSQQIKARRLFYALRSQLIYAHKHFSQLSIAGTYLSIMIGGLIARAVFTLAKRDIAGLKQLAQGYQLLWRWVLFHRNDPRAQLPE